MRTAWRDLLVVRHGDDRVRRRGRVLIIVLATLLALIAVSTPVVAVVVPAGGLAAALMSGLCLSYLGLVALARRGRVSAAAWLLLLAHYAALAGGAVAVGHVSNPPVFLPALVLMAGVGLSRRALPAALLGTVAATVALPLVVDGRTGPVAYPDLLVMGTLVAAFAGLVVTVAKRVVESSFEEAGQLTRALLASNAELEHRVAERTAELSAALVNARSLAEQLSELSERDHLTGLFNRRRLDAELDHLAATPSPLSLALLDLDDFKRINDTLGHHVGDVVLQRVAQTLLTGCRGNDVAARWGGEEFTLVMPATTLDAASTLCERLRLAVAALPFDDVAPGLRVTASFGLATSTSAPRPVVVEAGGDPRAVPARVRRDDLLRRADELLYTAKRTGKNRVAGRLEPSPGP
ncbi:GGDEF domain-containing protein [Paenibacillus sp. TRM 82003]|uniref:GGDEF domain-containing protein n=1 Tax=Kineococcus sp. TRM81007 TaxID=2925831 RepID=UPI001F55C6F9|nr:GGDEF domain-containing protein [Kineococcus sp. TRM81007]MCI2239227.1 GGDEF domain-containing protein [Kineococcus sp. TRM81007]MCI3924909.1 GGDEF domain-containing protein [Paenibacillus sp. TRM 82003]